MSGYFQFGVSCTEIKTFCVFFSTNEWIFRLRAALRMNLNLARLGRFLAKHEVESGRAIQLQGFLDQRIVAPRWTRILYVLLPSGFSV